MAKITIHQLSEEIERLNKEISYLKRDISELQTRTSTNQVVISRFKVYIDDKLGNVDIEKQVQAALESKETILEGLKKEIMPIKNKSRAVEVYKAYKKKEENGSHLPVSQG